MDASNPKNNKPDRPTQGEGHKHGSSSKENSEGKVSGGTNLRKTKKKRRQKNAEDRKRQRKEDTEAGIARIQLRVFGWAVPKVKEWIAQMGYFPPGGGPRSKTKQQPVVSPPRVGSGEATEPIFDASSNAEITALPHIDGTRTSKTQSERAQTEFGFGETKR